MKDFKSYIPEFDLKTLLKFIASFCDTTLDVCLLAEQKNNEELFSQSVKTFSKFNAVGFLLNVIFDEMPQEFSDEIFNLLNGKFKDSSEELFKLAKENKNNFDGKEDTNYVN